MASTSVGDYSRYEEYPDNELVEALAAAHTMAVTQGNRKLALKLQDEIDMQLDDGFGLYAAARNIVRVIDNVRYYSLSFKEVTLSPTASSGWGENGDQFLATVAGQLVKAADEYAEKRGWTK